LNPNDCKVSSKDTDGAMCIFEFTPGGGGLIHVYQPAGKMEELFRAVGEPKDLASREQVIKKTYTEEQRQTVR
jgi:hypothetical protein